MRICVDENIPLATVQALRDLNHDVLDVRGSADEGLPDADLWARAQSEQRLLVTTDKGFSLRRHEAHAGILIVRLRQPNRRRIHERVMQAMTQYPAERWPGLLVVMRDTVQSVWPPQA
jgi:predicted nuclease of predicted toxin-antitoxin system